MPRAEKLNVIDRAVHSAIRAWTIAMGDRPLARWEDAPHWAQELTRDSVDFVLTNPGCSPRQVHEFWKRQKQYRYPSDDSWAASINVSEDSFDQLSALEKGKDILVIELVKALA